MEDMRTRKGVERAEFVAMPTLPLADELARALRDVMAINGDPRRVDPSAPKYRYNPDLYETHITVWLNAKIALDLYDHELSKKS